MTPVRGLQIVGAVLALTIVTNSSTLGGDWQGEKLLVAQLLPGSGIPAPPPVAPPASPPAGDVRPAVPPVAPSATPPAGDVRPAAPPIAPPLDNPNILADFKARQAAEEDRMRLVIDEVIKKRAPMPGPSRTRLVTTSSANLDLVRNRTDLSDSMRQALSQRLTAALKDMDRPTASPKEKATVSATKPASITGINPISGSASGSAAPAASTRPASQLSQQAIDYANRVAQANAVASLKNRHNELSLLMEKLVDFDGISKPHTTLLQALDALQTQYKVTFWVNEKEFKKAQERPAGPTISLQMPFDVQTYDIVPTDNNPIPKMYKVTLGSVLNKILSRLPGEATWVVRQDSIEITTRDAMTRELISQMPPPSPPMPQQRQLAMPQQQAPFAMPQQAPFTMPQQRPFAMPQQQAPFAMPQQQAPFAMPQQRPFAMPQQQAPFAMPQQQAPFAMPQQAPFAMPQQAPFAMPQQGQPGMPQQAPFAMPQQGQPGMPQQGLPGMPQQGLPGMPQQGLPGMPQQGQPGMPQQGLPGMPQQGQPGMPQQGLPGMPQQGLPGMPQQGLPGQPVLQGIPPLPGGQGQAGGQGQGAIPAQGPVGGAVSPVGFPQQPQVVPTLPPPPRQ